MTRRQLQLFLAVDAVVMVALAVGIYFFWFAAPPAVGVVNTLGSEDAVAIRGLDPVAYFTLGQPAMGEPTMTADYQGATWRFASEEHRALFMANPEKYAPTYGGYCAFGVAKGALVKIEPEAWKIHDGRLYLNFDQNVQAQWAANVPEFLRLAEEQWPRLAQDAAAKAAKP